MSQAAREEILKKLRAAPKKEATSRPPVPALTELSLGKEQLIERFTENLAAQTGVVHRAKEYVEAAAKLAEIARTENLTTIMASTDAVLAPLNLKEWGREHQIEILLPTDFNNRNDFKDAVFDRVDAGITGVDYAVAESGTLCLIHDREQPRLISLAPITHIAVVPVDRLRPVYESVTDEVFGGKESLPAHVTFTTGPSMTGDIQGVPFKGMHGPKKVIVILIG
jgi:L-lactate dehydrogenase complex protein LldG